MRISKARVFLVDLSYAKTCEQYRNAAQQKYQTVLKRNIFREWKVFFEDTNVEKMKTAFEARLRKELEDLTFKFSKEIETLSNRVNDYKKENDELTFQRIGMQENLKKAFMRGVCALNFEAMSILGPNEQNAEIATADAATPTRTQKTMNLEATFSNNALVNMIPSVVSVTETPGRGLNTSLNDRDYTYGGLVHQNVMKDLNKVTDAVLRKDVSPLESPKKEVILLDNPKPVDTKNNRWKAAPVYGVDKENASPFRNYQTVEVNQKPSISQNIALPTNNILKREGIADSRRTDPEIRGSSSTA